MAVVRESGALGTYTKPEKDPYEELLEEKIWRKQNTNTTQPTTSSTTSKTTASTPNTTSSTTSSTTQTSPHANIDYAALIAQELAKDKPNWSTVAQYATQRDAKIAELGIQTESTADYIDRLLANRTAANDTRPTSSDEKVIKEIPEYPIETGPDPMQLIREYQEAQRQAQIAALERARNEALASLAEQEAGLAPQYYDLRNQAAAQSDINALNFAQYMASRGISGSAASMPELYRNVALQGQIGALNRQEQTMRDAIARDRARVQTAFESDVAAAQAGINAQALQALINQINADRAYRLQEAGLTGVLGGAPTLAAQQQAFNQALAEAGLTGYYQGQPTLAYRQWQADVDYRNRTFEENVRQFEKQYGLDLKRISLDQAQQDIDKQYKMGQLTQAQAQQALAQARFIEEQKQNNLANFNSYLRQAQQMLQGTYDSSRGSFVGSYTPSQVRAWVVALPLDEQQKADILNALGL